MARPAGRGRRGGGRDAERGDGLAEHVVRINRTSKTVKGGRRFGFSAVVVVGDQRGRAGFGFGKAREVQPAVEKGMKAARQDLRKYTLDGDTIPHTVWGRFGASRVFMRPARTGTGVIAGATVRAVLESVGVRNVLTHCYGSTNPVNLVKAVFQGLASMRSREEIERLRGVTLDEFGTSEETDVETMVAAPQEGTS